MKITAETKVISGIIFATLSIFIGSIFFLSKSDKPVSESEIVSDKSIHWHPKLTVYINGEKQEFTEDIGLGAVHQPMHTHAEDYRDGIVHMEMQGTVTKDETKIGNFFKVWGKQFNSNTLFNKTSGPEGTVKMAVNGSESRDFENYEMRDGDNIEIRFE